MLNLLLFVQPFVMKNFWGNSVHWFYDGILRILYVDLCYLRKHHVWRHFHLVSLEIRQSLSLHITFRIRILSPSDISRLSFPTTFYPSSCSPRETPQLIIIDHVTIFAGPEEAKEHLYSCKQLPMIQPILIIVQTFGGCIMADES